MSAPRESFLRRHDTALLIAALCACLAMLAGYNLYVAKVQHRNDVTATKVERMSDAACASTRLLYVIFNALAADSSPRFGSPDGGPIVPGARARLIGQLHAAERASVKGLRQQGCDVRPALP